MDERDNTEDQEEVQINLFAEEELTEGKVDEAEEEISVDFGETADSMLEVIKSDSLYGLERKAIAEEFDPGEISSAGASVVGDDDKTKPVSGELAEQSDLDEPLGAIEIQEEAVEEIPFDDVDDYALDFEQAERSRRRLRKILVICIVILLVLTAIIGLFVWRNSTPAAVKNPDSDALQTSSAGTNVTEFQALDAERIPDLVSYFGLTPEQAVDASGNALRLDAESSPAEDASLPNIKNMRTAWLIGDAGETLATITFGLNEGGQIEYVYASFDLDAFDVADSRFDELAANNIVAASILSGVGIDDATVNSAQLTTEGNPNAIIAHDTSKQEIAEFSGSTNREAAPQSWKVVETYDHSAGVSIGDNSVIRTIAIDLR